MNVNSDSSLPTYAESQSMTFPKPPSYRMIDIGNIPSPVVSPNDNEIDNWYRKTYRRALITSVCLVIGGGIFTLIGISLYAIVHTRETDGQR